MSEIPVTVDEKYKPVFDKITTLTNELSKCYVDAVTSGREEVQRIANENATNNLYGRNGALTKFTDLTVTQANYMYYKSILALQRAIEHAKLKVTDHKRIFEIGLSHGFNEEESLCVYNMVLYAKAINNLESQKSTLVEFLLSENKLSPVEKGASKTQASTGQRIVSY